MTVVGFAWPLPRTRSFHVATAPHTTGSDAIIAETCTIEAYYIIIAAIINDNHSSSILGHGTTAEICRRLGKIT